MTTIEASGFSRLIGIWETRGIVVLGNKKLTLEGKDSYEYILSKKYILHKADVKIGDEKSETHEIIEVDATALNAQMHYFNSKGESGKMTGAIGENNFTITGSGIKFVGTINNSNNEITGNWYLPDGNKNWNNFIELSLKKQ